MSTMSKSSVNRSSQSSHGSGKRDIGIAVGSCVPSMKTVYTVEKLLGEGGFGAVYLVKDQKDKKAYAMKVERVRKDPRKSKLKMEVQILETVQKERAEHSHFTQIIDKGKKPKYCFLVMTLVGNSLDDLKRKRFGKVFSMATGLAASLQCLEALEDLHKFGIVHRDIKPANYAVGLHEKARTIFILDFGIARKITKDDNTLKPPRTKVHFKGTVRFAALACHQCKELGPKDDCESWLYLLLDIIHPDGLPWRKLTAKADVEQSKHECQQKGNNEDMFKGLNCKEQLEKIFSYIISLAYVDKVDYNFIYESLKQAAASCKANLDAPFDWEAADTE